MKVWSARVLLAFVVFSLGFGVGREVGRRQAAAVAPAVAAPAAASTVMVYYLHATFRCVTCNTIEALAKEVLATQFAPEVAAGRIVWREVDFQAEEALAKRFDVVSSCVVVARLVDGRETGFQRLDEVWTLVDRPAELKEHVTAAIRRYTEPAGGVPAGG